MSELKGSIVFAVIVLAVLLVSATILHRKINNSMLQAHHEVVGFIYSNIGIMFSILLAFVVIVVWEQFREAEQNVASEANHAANLFRDTEMLPEPARREIRAQILEYLKAVLEKDWPLMAQNRISEESVVAYHGIWKALYACSPSADKERVWYEECVQQINQLGSYRRLRLMSAEFEVPPFMWVIMIIGAAITVSFVFLFGTERLSIKLILVTALALSVSLVFVLIEGLEHPYSGIVAVSPEPFVLQLKHLSAILGP